jgi:hypothetical protein
MPTGRCVYTADHDGFWDIDGVDIETGKAFFTSTATSDLLVSQRTGR